MFRFELYRDNCDLIGHVTLTPAEIGRYTTLAFLGNGCVPLSQLDGDYELLPFHLIDDHAEPLSDASYVYVGLYAPAGQPTPTTTPRG
jgi:hypothetical protein